MAPAVSSRRGFRCHRYSVTDDKLDRVTKVLKQTIIIQSLVDCKFKPFKIRIYTQPFNG